MKNAAKALTGCTLVIAAMAGLYFKVEYSGYVLLAGMAVAWSVQDD